MNNKQIITESKQQPGFRTFEHSECIILCLSNNSHNSHNNHGLVTL